MEYSFKIVGQMFRKKITKAIIPAAGLGTRFLPVTKSIPKEMIPILDTPTIDLIVQEAIQSGIKEILIIVSFTKYAIKNFYSENLKLERSLLKVGKRDLCKKLHSIGAGAKIRFKIQLSPKGLGHAIYLAKSFVKDEPFAILLGDDVILKNTPKTLPAIKQLIDIYSKYHQSVVGVKNVQKHEVEKYGIVKPKASPNPNLHEIESMIEKPKMSEAPSTLAITGRYVLTPEIFKHLSKRRIGTGGEIQLTDAIIGLMNTQKVYALNYEGTRYDIGSKTGLVKATVDFALSDPNIKEDIKEYLLSVTKNF
jgi:UTP--glucose-1-phosphate uridylyltransferase